MDHDDATPTYDIGHCRPPVATRFKPGQSGNPAGKKPGTKSLRALFLKAAFAKPHRRYPGDMGANCATQLEAMFARLLDAAAHGDDKATACVLALCKAHLAEDPDGVRSADVAEDASADPV